MGSVRDLEDDFTANMTFTNPFKCVAELRNWIHGADHRLDQTLRDGTRHLRKLLHAGRAARGHAPDPAGRSLGDKRRIRQAAQRDIAAARPDEGTQAAGRAAVGGVQYGIDLADIVMPTVESILKTNIDT